MKAEMLATVRERERERELYFSIIAFFGIENINNVINRMMDCQQRDGPSFLCEKCIN